MRYDVLIVGAGPAGLKCAEVLGGNGLKVGLIEKNSQIGRKVCAGGITSGVKIPADLEKRCTSFTRQEIIINNKKYSVELDDPVRMINRLEFGEHLAGLLSSYSDVELLTGVEVKSVFASPAEVYDDSVKNRDSNTVTRTGNGDFKSGGYVLTRDGEKISFDILVGADGSHSVVRRFLGLKSAFHIGGHYEIEKRFDRMVWYFNPEYLKNGYCWIFPHREFTSCGVYCDPEKASFPVSRNVLDAFLEGMGLSPRGYRFRGFPENYLYNGLKFGGIYLCGDASGVAFPATGEGIYPAVITGECVANDILGRDEPFALMEPVLRHRKLQLFGLNLLKKMDVPAIQSMILRLIVAFAKRRIGERWRL